MSVARNFKSRCILGLRAIRVVFSWNRFCVVICGIIGVGLLEPDITTIQVGRKGDPEEVGDEEVGCEL